jgi:hypothetical protein
VRIFSLAVFLVLTITGCTYSDPEARTWIRDTSIKPGTYLFAVAVLYRKIQRPTGFFNTFPNGGIDKVLEQSAVLYLCDASSGTARLLAEIEPSSTIMTAFDVHLGGWQDDELDFVLSGCPGRECYGSLVRREAFRMSPSGIYRNLRSASQVRPKRGTSLARMPGEKRYLRVSADTGEIKILTVEGGEFELRFTLDLKSIIPSSDLSSAVE